MIPYIVAFCVIAGLLLGLLMVVGLAEGLRRWINHMAGGEAVENAYDLLWALAGIGGIVWLFFWIANDVAANS